MSEIPDVEDYLAAAKRERERLIWAQFYCAVMVMKQDPSFYAEVADKMLEEYRKRWEAKAVGEA